jgi:nicotinamidase-related amidase
VSTLNRDGRTCLLVIDLQTAVVGDCLDRDGVLDRTGCLIGHARAGNIPVVYIQHEGPGPERGTDGWRLAPPLRPAPAETVVAKTFRDAFAATELEAVLAGLGVERLVVASAQSDFCVRATMQRAAADGYDVTLVGDCHTTTDVTFDGGAISAAQIVAHTNLYLSTLRCPGQTFAVARHDQIVNPPSTLTVAPVM